MSCNPGPPVPASAATPAPAGVGEVVTLSTPVRKGRQVLGVSTPESPESPLSKRRRLNRRRAQKSRARRLSSSSAIDVNGRRKNAAAGNIDRDEFIVVTVCTYTCCPLCVYVCDYILIVL